MSYSALASLRLRVLFVYLAVSFCFLGEVSALTARALRVSMLQRGSGTYNRAQLSRIYAETTIVSPFDASGAAARQGTGSAADDDDDKDDYELSLTRENVELVLDEMRPFLQADGYSFTSLSSVEEKCLLF